MVLRIIAELFLDCIVMVYDLAGLTDGEYIENNALHFKAAPSDLGRTLFDEKSNMCDLNPFLGDRINLPLEFF